MGYRLTALGWTLVAVLAITIVTAAVILLTAGARSDQQSGQVGEQARQTANPSSSDTMEANRVFDGYDAIDFVQATYDIYTTSITAEPETTRSAKPPYDLNLMLQRLETVRTRLSANLLLDMRARYIQADVSGDVNRDELLCGASGSSRVDVRQKLGGAQAVVVEVMRQNQNDTGPTAPHEVTVDLVQRTIIAIKC